MKLRADARLGPYQLLGPLGAGGMGEVYKARDTRLDRTVAIKVLPTQFAADPGRRERFEREARAVAALNHPHICDVHDVGEVQNPEPAAAGAESIRFLVMEYLEGQTLAERLLRGPLPAAEAVRCAIELADALDHAHRHGVVHRDLKPGNVMMTRTGVKLLDFGLSKLQASPDLITLATVSSGGAPLTAEGTVLGTFPYMAPEQLAGREADARSDIFAFGAMVYEMATGRRAFEGTTAATVIGAILHTDPPPVSSLQPLTPPALDRIVSRCLAKDPDDRWQTTRDLMLELKWTGEHHATPAPEGHRHKRPKLVLAVTAALLVTIVAAASAVVYMRRLPSAEPSVRLTFSPPAGVTLADLGIAGPVTISPDGRRATFVGSGSDGKRLLWVRELDSADAKALPGSDGASYPFWSPDSRRIGFFAQGNLKTINAAGGPPQTICAAAQARGGAWNQNGVIVFSGNIGEQLYRVSADGGAAVPLPGIDANQEHYWPSFLPDGRHLVYFARPEKPGIYLASLDSKDTTLLATAYVAVVHVPGYLLLLQSGSAAGASQTGALMAQPFDASRLQLTGDSFPVAGQVAYRTLWARAGFSVSNNGTLITERDTENSEVVWFDRQGQRLQTVERIATAISHRWPELSPDDTIVAIDKLDPVVQTSDIHLLDLVRGTESSLTTDPALDANARWSPDGMQVVFDSARDELPPNLFRKPTTGGGREERLLKSSLVQHATDWSRDGRFVVFSMLDRKTQWDLWMLPMNSPPARGEPAPAPLLQTPFNEYNGRLSPDGRWIAYQSDESGVWEIYLREVATATDSARRQVSTDGGVWPVWRRDGNELFYIAADGTLMTIPVKLGRELEASAPRALFKTKVAELWNPIRNYSVARDGQRFLINTRIDEASSPPITVVLNWPGMRR